MVADLEIVDGLAQFVFNAEHGDPWHLNMLKSHGVTLEDPCSWGEFVNVIREQRPAIVSDHTLEPLAVNVNGAQVSVPDHFAVVRQQDDRLIPGVVGARFHLGQPIDAIDALRTLTADVKGEPSSAGLIANGSKFFASAKVEQFCLDLGNGDSVERYVMVAYGLDGSLSRNYVLSSIRPVCSNTVSAAMASRNAENSRKVRNTALTFAERDSVALVEMGDIIRAFAGENERIVRMIETPSRSTDIEAIAKMVMGDTKQTKRVIGELESISQTAPGQDLATAQGTMWGIHNSFTYFLDHVARVGGARKGSMDDLSVESGPVAADRLLSHRWFGRGAMHRDNLDVAINSILDDRKPIVAQSPGL